MRPNIIPYTRYSDLEKPQLHIYGQSLGSGGLGTDSVTPTQARYDVMYWYVLDGGVIDGLTTATIGTWAQKNVDGGAM